jgi:hypothetical protein
MKPVTVFAAVAQGAPHVAAEKSTSVQEVKRGETSTGQPGVGAV